jgi:hypothetical protein
MTQRNLLHRLMSRHLLDLRPDMRIVGAISSTHHDGDAGRTGG